MDGSQNQLGRRNNNGTALVLSNEMAHEGRIERLEIGLEKRDVREV